VTTEGWAALSTDASSGDGLDLYAYNTRAVAQHGGYGTYADFGCRVWLYGSTVDSPEVGAIIAKSGQITVADGASAPADVMKYNLGKTTTAGTVITGGRNAVMIHAPDMMGEGKGAADHGTLNIINSTLATSRKLKSTRDYATHIGKAAQAYIDYINGAALLIKSTSATINFERAKIDSFSGVAVMTVLNSDKMGNFLKAETDGSEVKPVAIFMKNMSVNADIKHMDYQRIMTLSLDRTTLKGAVVSGTMEDWNKLWAAFQRKDTRWVQNDKWSTFYGVRMTLKPGSTWEVSGPSLLSSLTVENGAALKGRVQVNGADITPTVGKTYTGKILVMPLAPAQQPVANALPNRPAITLTGIVRRVADSALDLALPDGRIVTAKIVGEARLEVSHQRALSDLKVGDFVGSGAVLQADGRRQAQEVHFIPENRRAARGGHRQQGDDASHTMTNATITQIANEKDGGLTMTLTYASGKQDIYVAPGTPITELTPADPGLLKTGAPVSVMGDQNPDGSFTARAIRFPASNPSN
jgi:hypothetical protein